MQKLTIEIQYDEGSEVPLHLYHAFEGAEFASVHDAGSRFSFTYIRGELQVPADHIRHYETVNRQAAVKGGCW